MTSNTPETQALLPVTAEDVDAALATFDGGLVRQNDERNARGYTTFYHPKDSMRAVLEEFSASRISHSLPGDVGMREACDDCGGQGIDTSEFGPTKPCRRCNGSGRQDPPLLVPRNPTDDMVQSGDNNQRSSNTGGVDGLRAHFTRMMEAAANYLEPTVYVARHPQHGLSGTCRFTTEFPMPDDNHSESAKADINGRRDQAFIRDMIYMLDGPEQRAALASLSTPTAEPMGEETLLRAVCDAQEVAPYRGWNLTALNKVADQIREHLGLPSIRDLNPDIAAMQDAAEANKDAIRALTTPPTPDRIGKDAVREALERVRAILEQGRDGASQYRQVRIVAALNEADRALSATPAQPVDETERLRAALEDTMSTLSAVKAEAIVDGGGTCLWIAEKLNQQMIDNRAALDAGRPQHKGEVSRG